MYSETMIAVRDVRALARWYRELLEADYDHGREDFDRIVADGKVILMLHHWDTDHGAFAKDPSANPGAGLLLWIFIDHLDAIHERARAMQAEIAKEPWINPRAGWREFTLIDPNGYRIAIAQF